MLFANIINKNSVSFVINITKISSFIILFAYISAQLPSKIFAQETCDKLLGNSAVTVNGPGEVYAGAVQQREVTVSGLIPDSRVEICIIGSTEGCFTPDLPQRGQIVLADGRVTGTFGHESWSLGGFVHKIRVQFFDRDNNPANTFCIASEFTPKFRAEAIQCTEATMTVTNRQGNANCVEPGDVITFSGTMVDKAELHPAPYANQQVTIGTFDNTSLSAATDMGGVFTKIFTVNPNISVSADVERWLQVWSPSNNGYSYSGCRIQKRITPTGQCPGEDTETEESENSNAFDLCSQIPSSQIPSPQGSVGDTTMARDACEACVGTGGVWTALGCIQTTNGSNIITSFVKIALGMAGGIGMLMIIASGAMFTMSRNDPTKVGNAKELLTSVIMGLLFIIFSVTILQFIGVTILKIPGFGV